jgi:hypothetical protein
MAAVYVYAASLERPIWQPAHIWRCFIRIECIQPISGSQIGVQQLNVSSRLAVSVCFSSSFTVSVRPLQCKRKLKIAGHWCYDSVSREAYGILWMERTNPTLENGASSSFGIFRVLTAV